MEENYLTLTEKFLDRYISDENKMDAIKDMFEILRLINKDTVATLKDITF